MPCGTPAVGLQSYLRNWGCCPAFLEGLAAEGACHFLPCEALGLAGGCLLEPNFECLPLFDWEEEKVPCLPFQESLCPEDDCSELWNWPALQAKRCFGKEGKWGLVFFLVTLSKEPGGRGRLKGVVLFGSLDNFCPEAFS